MSNRVGWGFLLETATRTRLTFAAQLAQRVRELLAASEESGEAFVAGCALGRHMAGLQIFVPRSAEASLAVIVEKAVQDLHNEIVEATTYSLGEIELPDPSAALLGDLRRASIPFRNAAIVAFPVGRAHAVPAARACVRELLRGERHGGVDRVVVATWTETHGAAGFSLGDDAAIGEELTDQELLETALSPEPPALDLRIADATDGTSVAAGTIGFPIVCGPPERLMGMTSSLLRSTALPDDLYVPMWNASVVDGLTPRHSRSPFDALGMAESLAPSPTGNRGALFRQPRGLPPVRMSGANVHGVSEAHRSLFKKREWTRKTDLGAGRYLVSAG